MVERILFTIRGVSAIQIDPKLHKVTVISTVGVDTLISKLIAFGKYAELWPGENPPNNIDPRSNEKSPEVTKPSKPVMNCEGIYISPTAGKTETGGRSSNAEGKMVNFGVEEAAAAETGNRPPSVIEQMVHQSYSTTEEQAQTSHSISLPPETCQSSFSSQLLPWFYLLYKELTETSEI